MKISGMNNKMIETSLALTKYKNLSTDQNAKSSLDKKMNLN